MAGQCSRLPDLAIAGGRDPICALKEALDTVAISAPLTYRGVSFGESSVALGRPDEAGSARAEGAGMFLQVFQGRVTDAAKVRQGLEDWVTRLASGAPGWLGSTEGVTDDGTFVAVARFDSTDSAQRNSGRAEQGEWWSGMSKLFVGEVTFHDCSQVTSFRAGGSDDAGFVQVMQGRTRDMARLRAISEELEQQFPDLRPDLLGYVVGEHDDDPGAFTFIGYFTGEDAARAGEREQPPPEAAELLREEMDLMQDVVYFDLHEPWLHSPRA
jgi:hypothetical protein